MTRLWAVILSLLLLGASARAEDWVSILSNGPASVKTPEESLAAAKPLMDAENRLIAADLQTVQAEVANLNALYQSNPALRPKISYVVGMIAGQRAQDSVLQPILPTLIAHLTDADVKTRLGAMGVIVSMRQPPAEALNTLIALSHTETDDDNSSTAIGAVARYCATSKPAVLALAAAAAPDQSDSKRVTALMIIGQTNCRDSELLNAVSAGLRSNEPMPTDGSSLPNVVAAAAWTAQRFGTAAGPLLADLRRIAGGNTEAAQNARQTLTQLSQ